MDPHPAPEGPEGVLSAYQARLLPARPMLATTKPGWIQRRSELRKQLWQVIGLDPQPERLPLEPSRSEEWVADGVRLTRLEWQTWPRVRAAGWLATPAEPTEERGPAVVLAHRSQTEALPWLVGLAKAGYTVLAPELAPFRDAFLGVASVATEVWTLIRAVEVLQARPEVDRDRVGLLGIKGGVSAATWLLALDEKERIKAASLYGPARYLRHHPAGPHATRVERDLVPGLARLTEGPELAGLASPRALQFVTEGEAGAAFGQREFAELRALYRLWGQEDRLQHASASEGPAATYLWLQRELRGDRKATEIQVPEGDTAPLAEWMEAQKPAANEGEKLIREWLLSRVATQPPALESKQSRRGWQESTREQLADVLGMDTPSVALDAELSELQAGQHAVTFFSEANVRVPALWQPGAEAGRRGVVLALHPDGKEAALTLPWVEGLVQAGWSALAPDVRLRGALKADLTRDGLMAGRPEVGMALTDTLASLRWLLGREEVDPGRVVVIGTGEQGLLALLAGGFDERVAAVVADCQDTTYRDGGEGLPLIPGILRYADVPQIASLVAPRLLWLYRVPEERVGFASRRFFDWTRRMHQGLGEDESLKMSTGPGPDPAGLVEWLERRLRKMRR